MLEPKNGFRNCKYMVMPWILEIPIASLSLFCQLASSRSLPWLHATWLVCLSDYYEKTIDPVFADDYVHSWPLFSFFLSTFFYFVLFIFVYFLKTYCCNSCSCNKKLELKFINSHSQIIHFLLDINSMLYISFQQSFHINCYLISEGKNL